METNLKDKDIMDKVNKNFNINNISDETLDTLSDIEEDLSNIQEEQNIDNIVDRRVDFLIKCMEQNIEHTRHVENERMNFIQIHLVLVGGILAFLSGSALERKSCVVLFILVAVTILGVFVKILVHRWNQVYASHRTCAIYCYTRIAELCDLKSQAKTEFPDDIIDKRQRKISDYHSKSIPFYPFTFSNSGKTGRMIKWFINGLITVSSIVTIGYSFELWILPVL